MSSPDPTTPTPTRDEATAGLFECLDDLAPPELHREVWQACMEPRWSFGNRSVDAQASRPFWKMDLDGVDVVDRLFAHARPRCEQLAGVSLRVLRQYANGHTYGLGGRPHFDDTRPHTYTLLYYPMLTWNPAWEGETLFFAPNGDVAGGLLPAPNRAVLFDARMLHGGRAPNRDCPELRVTLAFKLIA